MGACFFHVATFNVVTYICHVILEDHLQQSTFANQHVKLHLHLLVIARQLELVARRILKPHDVTPPQYNVLRILRGQQGKPMQVQHLASRMVDPASNASRIVDKLVAKGWADRTICPEDRRRADVVITPLGLSLLDALDKPMEALLTQPFADVTHDTAHGMNEILTQVLHNTDELLTQL